MQFSTYYPNLSYPTLGERRGVSDLARFSLDLEWARSVSDGARSRAYPSPPMSGSPPIPPRINPGFDNRGQVFGATSQDVSRVPARTQPFDTYAPTSTSMRAYQQDIHESTPFATYPRIGDGPVDQGSYQQQQPTMHIHQHQHQVPATQMPIMPLYPPRHSHPETYRGQPQGMPEAPGYTSPKGQRKTKGHVAAACVPCKRAHLRCDSQRPCSRCLTNGKESACIDVQHKKRGRPRLRDERDHRFEGMGQSFAPQLDQSTRRPVSRYNPSEPPMATPDSLQRSSSYRVLKSQGGQSMTPGYVDQAQSMTFFGSQMHPNARPLAPLDPLCVYLDMDLQVSSATRSFSDAIAIPAVVGRKLVDMVAVNDRDKVTYWQRSFEDERQEREPNYLPPIYGKTEENRVIQSLVLSLDELNQMRKVKQDFLAFRGPDGQLRNYPVRLGLAKKESTYYVIMVLETVAAPVGMQAVSPSAFSREGGYPFQQSFTPFTGAPTYGQYSSQYADPRAREPMHFRQPPPHAAPMKTNSSSSSVPTTPATPYYVQAFGKASEHGQYYEQRQVPRSEQNQNSRNEFQLPPIQSSSSALSGAGRNDDRGRVDIDGLLEKPGNQRESQ